MRTEEQKAMMAPIQVKFGSAIYDIKPLTMIPGQAWRTKLNEIMGPITQEFASRGNAVTTLRSALLDFPDKMIELIFAYAPDLPRERVMADATDEQMSAAFSEVMIVAYPYLAPLVTVTKILRPTSPQ